MINLKTLFVCGRRYRSSRWRLCFNVCFHHDQHWTIAPRSQGAESYLPHFSYIGVVLFRIAPPVFRNLERILQKIGICDMTLLLRPLLPPNTPKLTGHASGLASSAAEPPNPYGRFHAPVTLSSASPEDEVAAFFSDNERGRRGWRRSRC
jgi:hypothetical protein